MEPARCALLGSLLLLAGVAAVPRDLLYPHGPEAFDRQLPSEDEASSPEVQLTVPIALYDELYSSIYVNVNGLLSFLTEIPSFFNVQFPLEYPVIAPLYTDVDIRGGGAVYYRETQDETLLRRASETVHDNFREGRSFQATSLFIATWQDVGYFENGVDKANTFQAVVASDGASSYVFLLYADGGVQWIQGKGKSTRPDARAQAGIIAGDGRMTALRGSGTDQVQNLDRWSNSDVPGQWLYRIGRIGPTDSVGSPDLHTTYPGGAAPGSLPGQNSCAQGSTECHSKAQCFDYRPGFCCICRDGFYGNGRSCLQDEIPLRVNGKVSGSLNDVVLEELDLQSYVVTTDGRTYTAISRVPEALGFDLQSLNALGTSIAWLFAKPIKSTKNGYEITGGVYNHTMEVTFPQSGHRVTVSQKFLGLDVFDQLRTEVHVHGHIPAIPPDTRIEMDDYEEKLTRAAPGVIKSYFTRKFRAGGENGIETPFTVDQTMEYEECSAQPPDFTTLRLKYARNYILYESREKIVRFAMTSKVTPLGDDDPCKEEKIKCGPHSTCLVDNDNAKCVCNKGYQFLYEGGAEGTEHCVDVNECLAGQHRCHHHALCINEPGSYRCVCQSGYRGNGYQCEKLPGCSEARCHHNAECLELPSGVPECRCKPGFRGNGLQCHPEVPTGHETPHGGHPHGGGTQQESCYIARNCSPYAACKFEASVNEYTCVCLPGYQGDGYSCEASDSYRGHGTPRPTCLLDVCWCPTGFRLDQHRCVATEDVGSPPIVEDTEDVDEEGDNRDISCNVLSNCHPHAQCVYSGARSQYRCECNAGYEGDGYECSEIEISCLEVEICHMNATCAFNAHSGKYLCACNPGFDGDGTTCYPSGDCSSHADCSRNAQCLFHHVAQRYQCSCNVGFSGDGRICELDSEGACGVCAEHAQCQFRQDLSQFQCECGPGYVGDGASLCEREKPGCNVLNDCGQHAECVLNYHEASYRCRCKEGYTGDGQRCVSVRTCDQDRSICHADAECVPENRQYTCRCREGFAGDGLVCRRAQSHEGQFLLVNQGMATLRIPFKPSHTNRGRPIQIQYYQIAVGIDIDCLEGRMYWGDVSGKAIRSSKYDGGDRENFMLHHVEGPEGVAVDWVSRNIYWTDAALKHVAVATLDLPRHRRILVKDGLVNPRGIAIHPAHGKLFWSDWNREGPKIERSNMDGTGRTVFVRDRLQLPNSLAIDFERDELCWTDAGTKSVECIGMHSGHRRTVVAECSYPFGLAISPSHYYWTDWTTKKVESATRPAGELADALEVPLGGSGSLFGIVAVPDRCPRLSNACQREDACPAGQICLPNGHGSRSCVCPEDSEDSLCNDII